MVADTQTFSAQPHTINDKYRPDDSKDDHYYANIHFDKRIYRGSNYSKQSQGKQSDDPSQQSQHQRSVPLRPRKQVDPFSIELPKPERLPIDLLSHLVEKPSIITTNSGCAQTDAFLDRPAEEPFIPRKTGVDASTHIEEGELFDFDIEVEPILCVLVNKTLEQAMMEASEEFELAAYDSYKKEWIAKEIPERAEIDAIVEEERIRYQKTQAEKERIRKLNYDQVRKKLMCREVARKFCGPKLFEKAIISLNQDHGLLQSKDLKAVCTEFMPFLLDSTISKLKKDELEQRAFGQLIRNIKVEKKVTSEKSKQEYTQKMIAKAKEEAAKKEAEEAEKRRKEEEVAEQLAEDGGGEGE